MRKVTHDEYVQKLIKKLPHINAIETYTDSRISILHECRNCGNIFKHTPRALLKSTIGCPKCVTINNQRSHEEFLEEARIKKNHNVIIIGAYTGANNRIECKCARCNRTWYPLAQSILSGYGCQFCSNQENSRLLSNDEVSNRIQSTHGNNIIITSKYNGVDHGGTFKCLRCLKEWESIVRNVFSGAGCPNCDISYSKGEQYIKTILEENNISYETQKKFKGLRGARGGCLKYDFYLNDENTCIEFDGIQHFKIIEGWRDQFQFVVLNEHDALKDKYCKDNNIGLIRIDYQFNKHVINKIYGINNILDLFLNA